MGNAVFKSLTRLVGKAIGHFDLIDDRDRVLVALSGGKDSWSLLHALRYLQRKAPVRFELAAITIHPGPTAFDCGSVGRFMEQSDIPHFIVPGNIVEVVNENLTPGTNPCSFCSRLRRGMLYTYAARHGWNKIALGHHLDDFVETLLLNQFFNGTIKGMAPLLVADDGQNTVIRPLVYVREEMTRECAKILGVPILGCSCTYQGMSGSRRHWIKELLARVEQEIPGVKSSILAAMGRVNERHLIPCRSDAGTKKAIPPI
jgi:tRNA 2-thiocytidine biosynthesis protein TtcA